MAIRLTCHDCGHVFKAPDEYGGGDLVCPKCCAVAVSPSDNTPTQARPRAKLRGVAIMCGIALVVGCLAIAFIARQDRTPASGQLPVSAQPRVIVERTLGMSRSDFVTTLQKTYRLRQESDFLRPNGERFERYDIPETTTHVIIVSRDSVAKEVSIMSDGSSIPHSALVVRVVAGLLYGDPNEFFDRYNKALTQLKEPETVDVTIEIRGVSVNVYVVPVEGGTILWVTFKPDQPTRTGIGSRAVFAGDE